MRLAATRASLAAGLDVTYWLMAICAGVAFTLAIRAMPDVSLGHELAPAPARTIAPTRPEVRPAGREA